jgi:EpsI family protein
MSAAPGKLLLRRAWLVAAALLAAAMLANVLRYGAESSPAGQEGDLARLVRISVDGDNRRIMLSIAYGDRQLGDRLQAHRPEYCYQAQGFVVGAASDGQLATPYGALPIRRLLTHRPGRRETVSYWLTVGDQATLPGLARKLAQLRQVLSGRVPDGMLVRVSSIDDSAEAAYAAHDRFVADLLSVVPEADRIRLAGRFAT